ncbi:MAG: SOS response-associated peptidase [Desulfobacterota bacterium]|jgi:putative SOS response-associated peptidase YedK|nr:SOS response-associated peptidase [Thermodesulfobacteriota bacterium]
MCGRFIQVANPEKIRANLSGLEIDEAAAGVFRPRYNIAPTQDILTVLNTPTPTLTSTHWGLIPFWAKDRAVGGRMINARAETLASKPSFRDPFRKRRCIIFTDGFYEWKGKGRGKTPFFIRMKTGEPFALAGLWDRWTDRRTGQDILSSTIVTTEANALVSTIHDRMPAILEPGDYRLWLTAVPVSETALAGCLKPLSAQGMEAYEISGLVNSPGNDSPDCIRPV